MSNNANTKSQEFILYVLMWGAIWGIFESTVGYLLHIVSFGYSWLIWYPFACFVMANVYRRTGKTSSIILVGLICAAIKMLNLFLPGRIDKVINPAFSIVFEALAMGAAVFAANRLLGKKPKNVFIKAAFALCVNTGWRLIYVLYLSFLVPSWIRDVSVISSADKFIPFFITQNLITSAVIFIGYQFKPYIFRPLEKFELRLSGRLTSLPSSALSLVWIGVPALMVCVNIALQFMLR